MQGQIAWGDLDATVDRGHTYARAPIVEALIEIQAQTSQDLDLEAVRSIRLPGDWGSLPSGDPVVETQLQVSDGGVVSEASHVTGYVLRRSDGARVVQARRDRIAYSWLPPYDRWELFRQEAQDAWLAYVACTAPSAVTRLAVRFVNRIDIPRPAIEVKDYLRTALDISPYLPQQMHGYFAQVEIPLARHEATARVITAIGEPTAPGRTSLILDIDTFRTLPTPLPTSDAHEAIWSTLDVLRDAKNFVFESCITDATRGLIDSWPT